MEDLDEVEVLWPEYHACHTHTHTHTHAEADHKPLPSAPATSRHRQRFPALSKPVEVPIARAALLLRFKDVGDDRHLELEKDGGSKIIVPPHLLVSGRRLSSGESTTTAACTVLRSGRQHRRARELRHLRNSVLRMTGFIEG